MVKMKKRDRFAFAITFVLLLTAAVLKTSPGYAETTIPFGRPAIYSSVSNNFPTYNDSGSKHRGNDIQGSRNTAIYAVRSGTVRYAGWHNSYGNYISINDSEYGSIDFRYAHLSSFIVKAGDKVDAGDVIGYMGDTGNVTGVHLHLEGAWQGNWQTGFSDINLNTCFTRKNGYPGNAYNLSGSAPALATNSEAINYKLVYNENRAPGGVLRTTLNIPENLKTGTSWTLKGAVVSPYTLTHVDIWIENAEGSRIAGMNNPVNPGGYFFDIISIDYQVKMQNVSSAGTYYYCLYAEDTNGNKLTVKEAFRSSDSATTEITKTIRTGDSEPQETLIQSITFDPSNYDKKVGDTFTVTDGMLVRRPLLVGDSFVLTGFREEEWKDKLEVNE